MDNDHHHHHQHHGQSSSNRWYHAGLNKQRSCVGAKITFIFYHFLQSHDECNEDEDDDDDDDDKDDDNDDDWDNEHDEIPGLNTVAKYPARGIKK